MYAVRNSHSYSKKNCEELEEIPKNFNWCGTFSDISEGSKRFEIISPKQLRKFSGQCEINLLFSQIIQCNSQTRLLFFANILLYKK